MGHVLPTNQQRVKYQKEATATRGKKVVIKSQTAARKHVKQLLTGFRFPDEDPNTQIKVEIGGDLHPISCTEGDPGYIKGWKQVLEQTVPGVLETLGMQIFSGAQDAESGIIFDYGEDDEGEPDGAGDSEGADPQ